MAKKKMTLEEKLEEAIVKDIPYEVPENWVWSNIGSISLEIKNGTTIKQNKDEIGIKVTRIESLQNNGIDLNRLGTIVEIEKIKEQDYYIDGDIVLSHINSLEHVGKTALIDNSLLPLVHGMNLLRIRVNKNLILPKYFQFYTRGYDYKKFVIDRVNRAVNQVSLNQKNLSDVPMPIPPLKEQQRIVDKIESLFEKLDKAKKLIEEARDDFEKRKQSLLEKAFRGELTKEWRAKNNIIRSEERSKLGDIVKINPKRDKLIDIDDNKECTFVPMPSVSEITGVVENPLIEKYSKVKKGYTYFKENDVIFAKITPCMENGKSAIVTNLIDGIGFGSTEFHVIRCNENVLNRFIYHLVRSKFFRDSASQHMTGAVGQRRVPKSFLEEYEIVLPTIEEQKEIVRILDKLLEQESKIDELTKLEEQIELIKKSILAKAFRGQLGTNCEDDESAIELLKEILMK